MGLGRVNLADFGAVSGQDCQAAFSLAIAALGDGILEIPAGRFLLPSGVTLSRPIQVVGCGRNATQLDGDAGDVAVVIVDSPRCGLKDLAITGREGFPVASPALRLTGNAVETVLEDIWVLYGAPPIHNSATDVIMRGVVASWSYGFALVVDDSAGAWYGRCKFDQSWPVCQPTGLSAAIPNWAPGIHNPGDLVLRSGYILQCAQGGPTGAVAPDLANYGQLIVDGGVRWLLAAPPNCAGMIVSGDGAEHQMVQVDLSGCFVNGLVVAGAPLSVKLSQSVIGQHLCQGIALVGAGRNLIVADCEIAGGSFADNSAAIAVGPQWQGPVLVHDNFFLSAPSQMGMYIAGGSGSMVHDNSAQGFTLHGVHVVSGVSAFVHDNH